MSDHIEIAVMQSLCKQGGTPYARTLLSHLVRGDQKQLVLIDKPGVKSSTADFSIDYMLYSVLRKWTGLETGIDTRSVALSGWKVAESKCHQTNVNFRNLLSSRTHERTLMRISAIKRKIEQVLGNSPNLVKTFEGCRWSNGATFDLRRGTSIAQKISSERTVTREALPIAIAVLESDPHWVEAITGFFPEGPVSLLRPCKVVKGSRFLTVPKDAKTDRCIAAEPTMNTFLQQAVGRDLRRRLKRVGVDLDDQSRNQKLAFEALVDDLATLDLSMASDTIAKVVVWALLPPAWADLLDQLRSKWTKVDGEWVYLEKFSSMGNSFTFELESLIFWAVAAASCEEVGAPQESVGIFGDDIIVHQDADWLLRENLDTLGFTVNTDKSFGAGSVFFESCGKHFHHLEDVTPVYQKALIGTSVPELIRLHNRLWRWAARDRAVRVRVVYDALELIREYGLKLMKGIRLEQPPCEGDFGFITDKLDERPYKRSYGRLYNILTYEVPVKVIEDDLLNLSHYAYKLRRPSLSNPHPKGYYGKEGKGRYVLRKKYIEDPSP
jgi:hypothetical protein